MLGDAISPRMNSFDFCRLRGDARIPSLWHQSKLVACTIPYHLQVTKYTKSLLWETSVSGGKFEGIAEHQCLYWNAVAMYLRKT
jgi:hypothetical protein